jgi:hypothetical protein
MKKLEKFSQPHITQEDFGVPAQWHFFGTSHGKRACDGLGGILARHAT